MRVVPSPKKGLLKYEAGETLPVRYLGSDKWSGVLLVETVEGDHEPISGTIPPKEAVFFHHYKAEHFTKALKAGDVFNVKLLSSQKKTFSLKDTFTEAMVEFTVETQKEVDAVLLQVKPNGLQIWWTRDGYPAYTHEEEGEEVFNEGGTAVLMITKSNRNGYVNALVERRTESQIDVEASRSYCIEGMLYDEDATFPEAPEERTLSDSLVKGLCRMLFTYQRTVFLASERFRILSAPLSRMDPRMRLSSSLRNWSSPATG